MKKFIGVLALLCLHLPLAAQATLIDFELGPDPGTLRTFSGVQFSNSNGTSNVTVADFHHQSDGIGIGALNDLGREDGIRMRFPDVFDYLALDFGNDDPHAGYRWGIDGTALLTLFLNRVEVGRIFMAPNGDDILNQTISSYGISYDEATFQYVVAPPSQMGAIVAEVIDNVQFSRGVPVPEPSSGVLAAIGLLGLGAARMRKSKHSKLLGSDCGLFF